MKIDDAIIDKVLNNGASVEEAGLVAEWFAKSIMKKMNVN